jgi:hypothetical protein
MRGFACEGQISEKAALSHALDPFAARAKFRVAGSDPAYF